MDADTFVQYYMDSAFPSATLIKDCEDDSRIISNANDCAEILANQLRESASFINSGNYKMQYTVSAIPSTMSKRQYKSRRKLYRRFLCYNWN